MLVSEAVDWTGVWLGVANSISGRSHCFRMGVGAVVVSEDNHHVFVGYNGPPSGYRYRQDEKDCRHYCDRAHKKDPEPHYHDCPSIHAEVNALLHSDRSLIRGGTIYITTSPCWDCGKLIANSGLSQVVIQSGDTERERHRNPDHTIALLRDSGLDVEFVSREAS